MPPRFTNRVLQADRAGSAHAGYRTCRRCSRRRGRDAESPLVRTQRFGWGWTPITWQGWLLTAAFIVVMAVSMLPGVRCRLALVSGLTLA